MIGKNVISKEEISGTEVKEILEEFSENNKLNYTQNLTVNHLARFPRYSVEDAEKIIDELVGKLNLRKKVAVNIVNLIPQDLSDLRLIFAKEPHQADVDEMKQILEILEQYTIIE